MSKDRDDSPDPLDEPLDLVKQPEEEDDRTTSDDEAPGTDFPDEDSDEVEDPLEGWSDDGDEVDGWDDLDDLPDEPENLDLPAGPDDEDEDAPPDGELLDERTALDDAGDDEAWAELEDEGASLPPGRELVGWREFVSFPEHDLHGIVARMDTGSERSLLCGAVTAAGSDEVNIDLGERSVVLRIVEEDGHPTVRLRLQLGGSSRLLAFLVEDRLCRDPVVLGRDALEGYFVVDVAMSFLHKRQG